MAQSTVAGILATAVYPIFHYDHQRIWRYRREKCSELADDIHQLVEFNAAMALETEGRTLNLETLKAGIQGVFEDPSRGFYLVGEVPQGQTQPSSRGTTFDYV